MSANGNPRVLKSQRDSMERLSLTKRLKPRRMWLWIDLDAVPEGWTTRKLTGTVRQLQVLKVVEECSAGKFLFESRTKVGPNGLKLKCSEYTIGFESEAEMTMFNLAYGH